MFAAKSNESLKTESGVAGRGSKEPESHSSQSNPLWHKFATGMPAPPGSAARSVPLPVQAKLTISRPDDPYEQEADRVAEQVMRMPQNKIDGNDNSITVNPPSSIQRKPT